MFNRDCISSRVLWFPRLYICIYLLTRLRSLLFPADIAAASKIKTDSELSTSWLKKKSAYGKANAFSARRIYKKSIP